MYLGVEEIAQSVKCSPYKHEDFLRNEFSPQKQQQQQKTWYSST